MLSLIWWLVQRLGLPDWVVLVASALLLIGLPIMLLAARQERRRIMERTAGSIPRAPTGLAGRLLSWRGAIAAEAGVRRALSPGRRCSWGSG
jgi:hypothetical protein